MMSSFGWRTAGSGWPEPLLAGREQRSYRHRLQPVRGIVAERYRMQHVLQVSRVSMAGWAMATVRVSVTLYICSVRSAGRVHGVCNGAFVADDGFPPATAGRANPAGVH